MKPVTFYLKKTSFRIDPNVVTSPKKKYQKVQCKAISLIKYKLAFHDALHQCFASVLHPGTQEMYALKQDD